MINIQLYGATKEDYDEYYRIRCEKSDIYWMGHLKEPDYYKLREIFLERLGLTPLDSIGNKRIYMIRNDKNSVVGFSMLSRTEYGIEIGISLFQKEQGKGYGTQVISNIINLLKAYNCPIYAKIRDDNVASQSIFLRNGFERTDNFKLVQYPEVGTIPFRMYIYRL